MGATVSEHLVLALLLVVVGGLGVLTYGLGVLNVYLLLTVRQLKSSIAEMRNRPCATPCNDYLQIQRSGDEAQKTFRSLARRIEKLEDALAATLAAGMREIVDEITPTGKKT